MPVSQHYQSVIYATRTTSDSELMDTALIAESFGYVALVVAGILPIANPFSTAPLFVGLTADMKPAEQISQANRACVYMAVLLIGTFFLGAAILNFFGITIPAVRFAGGLIVFYIGIGMMFPSDVQALEKTVEETSGQKDFAFTPLAMPMLSGPGSIAVVLEMSARVADTEPFSRQIAGAIVVPLGILITVVVCWLVLRAAGTMVSRLGAARIDVITRMLGFLLICLGVQFAAGGIRGFLGA
jgi:multiple antibiotic resistance protein